MAITIPSLFNIDRLCDKEAMTLPRPAETRVAVSRLLARVCGKAYRETRGLHECAALTLGEIDSPLESETVEALFTSAVEQLKAFRREALESRSEDALYCADDALNVLHTVAGHFIKA